MPLGAVEDEPIGETLKAGGFARRDDAWVLVVNGADGLIAAFVFRGASAQRRTKSFWVEADCLRGRIDFAVLQGAKATLHVFRMTRSHATRDEAFFQVAFERSWIADAPRYGVSDAIEELSCAQ